MGEEITPELIFRKLSEEKRTGEIQPLSEDFYAKIRNTALTMSKDKKTQGEAENTVRMFTALAEKRKQKLLLYLAYNKPLPKPLPKEEENLYSEMQKILNNEISEVRITKIKIITELPEVITPYGKKLGPYKNGEVLEVYDDKDAGFLINNKIGEKV